MSRTLRMEVQDLTLDPPEGPYHPGRIGTNRGEVPIRVYPAESNRAALYVGGCGGGWDSPGRDLYPHWCAQLVSQGVIGLRLRFRDASALAESVLDVLAGLAFLASTGVEQVTLVGHSFGGAVVIQAAAASPLVTRVATLATQSYGADAIAELGPRVAALLIHGAADRVLPAACSEGLYRLAREPRRLLLIPGADHCFEQAGHDEVERAVRDWILHGPGGSSANQA
jgi:hypothetical protein